MFQAYQDINTITDDHLLYELFLITITMCVAGYYIYIKFSLFKLY